MPSSTPANPTSTPSLALIALGSNLGNSRETILNAFEALQKLAASPLKKSSLWESTPVDCPPGSPKFVNAAASFLPVPGETPESLLAKLQSLEKEFGRRQKQVMNEPRPLDLDLIAFGQETRSTSHLTLPHPRAHLRRFVLQPLDDIEPDFILRGQTQSIHQLLTSLSMDEILTLLEK